MVRLMAPAKTPHEIVGEATKGPHARQHSRPRLRERLAKAMLDVAALTGEQLSEKMRAESAANKAAIERIRTPVQ